MEKQFPQGIRISNPHEKAPNYIRAKVSIKVDEFIQWLSEFQDNGWVNLSLNKSQKGVLYFELDTWKPNTQKVEKYKSQPNVEDEVSAQQEMYGDYRPEDNGEERSEIEVDKIPF